MVEKGFGRADLEKMIEDLERRQEKRQDEQLRGVEERIVNQFHIISEGLIDQIKLLAEGHVGIIGGLNRVDDRLERIEKENEREHLETRALVKLSFAELDRRLSDLETQIREIQEWKRKVESRLQA